VVAYDEFIDLAHRKVRPAAPAAAEAPPVRARGQRSRAAASGAARVPPPAPAPAPLPAEVAGILDAVPGLRGGAAMQLGEVGEAMRRHELLTSKRASPSGLLKRHAAYFELVPADRPRTVRFLGGR
jgi:hypothetical protein